MKKQWNEPKLESLDVTMTEFGSGGTQRDGYVYDDLKKEIIEEFFIS
jgi:hypothetical protein